MPEPTIGGYTADQLHNLIMARALELAKVRRSRDGEHPFTDYEAPYVRLGVSAAITAAVSMLTDLGVPLQDPAKPPQVPRETSPFAPSAQCTCPRIDVGTLMDEPGSVTVPGTPDRDCPVHGLPKCTCGAAPFQPWHHPSCPRAL